MWRKGTERSKPRRGTHSGLTKQEVSSEQEPGRSLFLFDAQLYPSSDLEFIFLVGGRSQLGQEEKASGQSRKSPVKDVREGQTELLLGACGGKTAFRVTSQRQQLSPSLKPTSSVFSPTCLRQRNRADLRWQCLSEPWFPAKPWAAICLHPDLGKGRPPSHAAHRSDPVGESFSISIFETLCARAHLFFLLSCFLSFLRTGIVML